MAKHSATHFSNRTRKASADRTAKTVERYYGKLALAETWKDLDPVYWRELWNEAEALRKTLEVKGAL
jgi:hypothetical protein